MQRVALLLTGLIATGAMLLANASPAAAKSKRQASYEFKRVWPAAVRFIRVDEGHKIIEKDASTGYVLFELKEDRRTFRGALEIVKTKDSEGRSAVRLVLRLNNRPSYMEVIKLDKLLDKLKQELGEPVAPPVAAPEKPAPPAKPKTDDKKK